jgi:heat shock protein HtpX
MSKRISLFILVNFLVVLSISFFIHLLKLEPKLASHGIKYLNLMVFCLIWGFGGSLLTLLISRITAKKIFKIQIIDPNTYNEELHALVEIVHDLARKAGIKTMPQVGIYESFEINAFATGPTKNRSLVAFSSGLLQQMSAQQIHGVIGHEISHIANGDMITMTLIQGIVNSFTLFFPRLISIVLTDKSTSGFTFFIRYALTIALEIVFGILGSIVVCYFSRRREFRADKGGAALCGTSHMVMALQAT